MRRRRGSMLIELCGAIAGGCAVMLTGISLIERTLHFGKLVQAQAEVQRELGQLAQAWREDAIGAVIENESSEVVTLRKLDERIVYRWQPGIVSRESTKSDASESEDVKTRTVMERYRLGADYHVSFAQGVLTVRHFDSSRAEGDSSRAEGRLRLRVVGKFKARAEGIDWQERSTRSLETKALDQEVADVR